MNASARKGLSRRGLLAGSGALVVSFSLKTTGLAQQTGEAQNAGTAPARPAPLPGSLDKTPMLDAWIRVDADGTISIFTGKAELGQGIKTALIQVAAEQLDVASQSVHLVAADTARTPNEGYTAGSHSMQDSGTAIMHAAAQVREILLGIAAERLSLPIEQLAARDGAIVAGDGRLIGYGELDYRGCSARARIANIGPKGPRGLPGHRHGNAARRHPGQGHGRGGLCA